MTRGRSGLRTRALAIAAAAALLVVAMPAGLPAAARADVPCLVHNLNTSSDRDSLQRAVRAADAGDALLVQGTCTGTTLIDKDLDIAYLGWSGAPLPLGSRYVADPRGRIASGGPGPALVVDPSVERLVINPGLVVAGGIVIDELGSWSRGSKAPAAWRRAAPSIAASIPSSSLADCHLRNDESGNEYTASQPALGAARAGDRISLRGTCGGEAVFERAASVAGWRIAISSMSLGEAPESADDSGPATLARVRVDGGVDDLVLKDVRITDGFRISS